MTMPLRMKRWGGVFSDSCCALFRERMDLCSLSDLGAVGPNFTWWGPMANNQRIRVRLDRAMASLDWRMMFAEANVTVLPRTDSDHLPLLLRTKGNVLVSGRKAISLLGCVASS